MYRFSVLRTLSGVASTQLDDRGILNRSTLRKTDKGSLTWNYLQESLDENLMVHLTLSSSQFFYLLIPVNRHSPKLYKTPAWTSLSLSIAVFLLVYPVSRRFFSWFSFLSSQQSFYVILPTKQGVRPVCYFFSDATVVYVMCNIAREFSTFSDRCNWTNFVYDVVNL